MSLIMHLLEARDATSVKAKISLVLHWPEARETRREGWFLILSSTKWTSYLKIINKDGRLKLKDTETPSEGAY